MSHGAHPLGVLGWGREAERRSRALTGIDGAQLAAGSVESLL
jgi:hypothetical protein